MKFITYLNKYFDTDRELVIDDESGEEITKIWVYEKGEDSEPLLILKEAIKHNNKWIILNIYSLVENNLLVSESDFRNLVRNNKVKSKFY